MAVFPEQERRRCQN